MSNFYELFVDYDCVNKQLLYKFILKLKKEMKKIIVIKLIIYLNICLHHFLTILHLSPPIFSINLKKIDDKNNNHINNNINKIK